MCPVVPSLNTKAIYLPEMTACVWVCVCVCTLMYHTQCFRNHNSPSKIVEMVVAHCSGCNSVAVNHVSYKKTVTLWDGAVSDLHVTMTAVVASFRSRDTWQLLSLKRWMALWIQCFMCWTLWCCSWWSNRGGGTRCKTVLHAYVVILSLLYYTYTRQTDRVYVVASHFISLSPEYSTTTYWKPSSIEHLGFYMSPGGLLCNEESFTNPNL